MDHRCLYGHRVADSFRYAIERDMCPVCGAELISLEGYKLARSLADIVPLDGVIAFKTARMLLRTYTLTPRTGIDAHPASSSAPTASSAPVASSKAATSTRPAPTATASSRSNGVPAGTEVQLDEEELVAKRPAPPSPSLEDELEDAESVELIAADPTDEQPGAAEAMRRNGSEDLLFSDAEDAFFSSAP